MVTFTICTNTSYRAVGTISKGTCKYKINDMSVFGSIDISCALWTSPTARCTVLVQLVINVHRNDMYHHTL